MPTGSISLTVPEGTPLPIVLDKEVRLRKVGQPIRGKIAKPVYAFDKLVVPAGSQVTGKVIAIARVSVQKRTLAALDANFSPYREMQVSFDGFDIGRRQARALQTIVSPASQGVLQFAAAADPANQNKRDKKTQAKKLASSKVSEARQEISRNWETAKQQVKASGKVHRLERYAVAQLPYHPQYLDAGMRYNAELKQPLDFGNQSPSPEAGRIAAPDAPLRLAACQEPIVPTENSIALKKRKRQQEGTKFVGPLGFRARMARSTGPRVKHRMAAKRRSTAVLNSNS